MELMEVCIRIMQIILNLGSICVMLYALSKFLSRPHNDLEQRVSDLEFKQKETDNALRLGNDRFRAQKRTNRAFMSIMLSFVDFEIAYCLHTNYEFTEDLMKAKKNLQNYASGNEEYEE